MYGALLMCLLMSQPVAAEMARVAVAANFTQVAREIGGLFEVHTGHRAVLSFGSTGQLYAQISQGAPFDVFLAADQERPAMAIEQGLAVAGTGFTYARGRLVLFSRDAALVKDDSTLRDGQFTRIAVANPVTAPYGVAAAAVLRALGVHDSLAPRMVRGNNIAQTYQFVVTGNAELGLVAFSQVVDHGAGSYWLVPEHLHAPIAQDAVLLRHGQDNPAARAFLDFLQGPQADAVKARYGYAAGGGVRND
jgi:molybdate transport system substrate-binding protein